MSREIAHGVGWMVLFKLIDRVLAIVSTLILARLLVPADFGLVAMAMSVIALLELATAFSFEVPLIQKREVRRAHYDTAWTLNLALASTFAALTAALALPSAAFYDEPRVVSVMLVLAGGWIVSGFENIGIVDFRRNLDFRREFYFLASKRALSFGITITLALSLQSYWALVIGSVVGRLLGVVLSYSLHPFRPTFSLARSRELFGFSSWMLINNALGVLQIRIPHFTVGRFLGSESLGLFTVGAEIAQIPSSDLTAPINRVIFPGFSRLATDAGQLQRTFLDVIAVTTMAAFPAAVGIAAVADPLVLVLLGSKWSGAVPIIEILAVAAAVSVISANNGSAYLALGQPQLATLISAVRLSVLAPLAIILTMQIGFVGAAYAELAASVVGLLASLPLLLRRLNLRANDYFARLWRPVIASTFMAYSVTWLLDSFPPQPTSLGALPSLCAAIGVGVSSYVASIAVVWLGSGRPRGAEQILVARITAALQGAVRTQPPS
jgi:lipopolysaccharide exporter